MECNLRERNLDKRDHGFIIPFEPIATKRKQPEEFMAAVSCSRPEVREKMLQEGAEPIGNSPEEFAAFLAEDLRKWAGVIKAANLRPSQI